MSGREEGVGMGTVVFAATQRRRFTLDGVEVDLEHPDLGPDWVLMPSASREFGLLQEGILFPSEQHQPLEDLRKNRGLPDSFFLLYADPGDRLVITNVVSKISGKKYDHDDDRTSRLAFMTLIRACGGAVALPTPLRFVREAGLKDGNPITAFENVCIRLGEMAAAAGATEEQRKAWTVALFARQTLDKLLSRDEDEETRALLLVLANFAAQAGYHLGRLEVADLEASKDKQILNAHLSGQSKTSGSQLAQAKRMAEEHPDWSRTMLAKNLVPLWHREQRSISRTLDRYAIGPEPRHRQ